MKTSQPKGSEALLLTRTQLASCHSTAAQVMNAFKRNKIRHELLPLLRELNPSIDRTLAETITRLNEEKENANKEKKKQDAG